MYIIYIQFKIIIANRKSRVGGQRRRWRRRQLSGEGIRTDQDWALAKRAQCPLPAALTWGLRLGLAVDWPAASTYRAVVQWGTANSYGESRWLWTGGLYVAHIVGPGRAVHVDGGSGRVGWGKALSSGCGGSRGVRRCRRTKAVGGCSGSLIVVHHCGKEGERIIRRILLPQ